MHATNPPSLDPQFTRDRGDERDVDPDVAPSLWQELADGSAGAGVKAAVTVALAPLLAGVGLLLAYLFALWGLGNRPWAAPYIVPTDELVAVLMVAAGLAYVAAVAWIWTRRRPKHRSLWGAALLTVGIIAVTSVLCVLVDGGLRGSGEIVIGGLVCLAGASVVLTWVQAARHYRRAVPMRDRRDGTLDVRCPTCGYRMVGLHESRCPECGTAYTLDELLGRQHFLTHADRQRAGVGRGAGGSGVATSPPPPPPPPRTTTDVPASVGPA